MAGGLELPEDPEQKLKVEVCRTPDYVIMLSQSDDLVFVHCDILGRWSSTVKRQLLAHWASIKSLAGRTIYALHDPDDIKHMKFLQIVGMRPETSYIDRATQRKTVIYAT